MHTKKVVRTSARAHRHGLGVLAALDEDHAVVADLALLDKLEGGNLSEGSLEGKILTCPIHGSKFDVTTGKCVHRPRNLFSQAKKDDAVSYELRLNGEDILLQKESPWSVS